MAKRLTWFILLGLVAGVAVGLSLHFALNDGTPAGVARMKDVAGDFAILTTIFLRLIKMIIAPLVFATLVAGVAQMGDTRALGRVGGRAIGWFIGMSLISLTLGLVLVTVLHPGTGITPDAAAGGADAAVKTDAFTLAGFVTHIVPQSMIEAMATNEILQIVVFSLFVGVAISTVGAPAAPLVRAVDGLVAVMLRITEYVMRFAPFAVFGAVTATLTERGPAVIARLAFFMSSFYLALAILWAVQLGAGWAVAGGRMRGLLRQIREPLLIAFTTASSEAAYPRLLEQLERFGVPNRIASFVLPLGYSFNLVGSMIYMTFASLFIAQAYGIHLTLGTQVAMLLYLMISSKGIAGVPRASLVVIAATLPAFGIPEAGLGLILGIDHFLDMGRTATNLIGNAVASVAVARWEGGLGPALASDAELAAAAHA